MKHDLFISYSRRNLQQVVAIRDELKDQVGVDSWIDLKGIESGEQFVNVIVKAIDDAKVVLFMMSQASMASEYTKKEVMYARNVGKKVVPIVLDDSKLSGWFLFEFGVVDYINIQDPLQKKKFYENIKGWLGLTDNDEGPIDFFETGMHYYLKQDYEIALDWFMKASKFGYAEAFYYIGLCYNYGQGVSLDYSKAMEWFQKASQQNHAEAQNRIGILYKHGMGVPQDDVEALRWYRKAAANNCIDAKYNIGKSYYYGRGVEIDLKEAFKWFEQTANDGYVKAQSTLAYCFLSGEGVAQNYEEAVKWFRKAAEKGTPGSQYHLGYCYYHGLGVEQDYCQAVHWFEQAIKKNHAASEYYLGL